MQRLGEQKLGVKDVKGTKAGYKGYWILRVQRLDMRGEKMA